LERIKTSGDAIRSLDTLGDCFLSGKLGDKNRKLPIEFRRPKLSQIANKVAVQYLLDPTLGGWGNPDAYNGLTEDSDSGSITTYKERKKTWLMWAVRDDAMADTLRDYLLDYHKLPRQAISFPTDWTQLELKNNDLIDLTCSQLGLAGRTHRIFDVGYDLPIPLGGKGLKTWLTMIDLFLIKAILSDTVDLADVLEITATKVLDDSFSLSEAIAMASEFREISDSLGITESRILLARVVLTDTVFVTDLTGDYILPDGSWLADGSVRPSGRQPAITVTLNP
jgi:hypothetical protein